MIVLVFLAVASLLFANWARTAVLERQQLQNHAYRLQAEWLAESALERAAARLGADQQYSGETWQLTAAELGGTHDGTVTIRVTPAQRSPGWLLRVEAEYPAGSPEPARRSRELTIPRPGESS